MAKYRNLHYFPLGLFLIFPITFLTTYSIAVYWDHVSPIMPYISETGALSPESCIFSQMLNIGAILLCICVYIRYRQIEEFSKLFPAQCLPLYFNKISAILGVLTCVGLDIAANFQESKVATFHLLGAFVCFMSGTLYFCLQTILTSNTAPHIASGFVVKTRISLSILSILFTFGTIFPGVMSVKYFTGTDYKKWGIDDGGYEWHLISVLCEWLLALTYSTYALTFFPEFRRIHIEIPAIEIKDLQIRETKEMTQPDIRYV